MNSVFSRTFLAYIAAGNRRGLEALLIAKVANGQLIDVA
jgi:hypothetical protein